jgi:hypothetical protein
MDGAGRGELGGRCVMRLETRQDAWEGPSRKGRDPRPAKRLGLRLAAGDRWLESQSPTTRRYSFGLLGGAGEGDENDGHH